MIFFIHKDFNFYVTIKQQVKIKILKENIFIPFIKKIKWLNSI